MCKVIEARPELEVELVVDVHDTAKHSTATGGKAPTMGVATVAVALLAVVNGLIWYTGAFGFYVGLAALAVHGTSGLLLLAMLFAKGVVLCTGVSLRYIGQSHEFDAQIDRELAAKDTPFEDLYLRTIYAGFACSFKPLAPWMDVDGLIEDVKHRYPKSMCGWAVEASLHRGMGEWQKAVDAYRTAQRVATEYPEHNPEPLVSFLLPCSAEHAVQSYSWAMSLRELVPGEVWVLNTPLLVKLEFPGRPWEINTTIVKLHSGDVVIFNPGTFTEESDEGREMLKRVRAIGRIVAVVSTTAPHGVGLERARHFFPEAKLYGMEPSKKHQRPEVSWDGWLPLMDASEPFGEELVHLTLRGQAFCETVFYHRSSGTLIGLTDTVMKTDGHDWVFRWYLFGLGMWRSSRTTKYACQSYNYMMVTNPSEYRASIAKMLSWDIRTVVFGHGGIEEGASECQRELRGAFQWILEGYNHSRVARIGLWLAWMENSRFLYIMMRAASGKLMSSLFGSGAGKSDAQRE